MVTLPLKSSNNEQHAVIRFFCGQKDLMKMRFTLHGDGDNGTIAVTAVVPR